jgi:hypothetical protein
MFDKKNLKKYSDYINNILVWRLVVGYSIFISCLVFILVIYGIFAVIGAQTICDTNPQYEFILIPIFNIMHFSTVCIMGAVLLIAIVVLIGSCIDWYLEKTKDEL